MSLSKTPQTQHVLTVDAEDWPALMCSYLGHAMPASAQFPETLRRVMDLFDAHDAKATFFVVGTHAKDWPEVVREIVDRGHELASHGWAHRKTDRLSPETFREDVRRSVGTLEDLTGVKVRGYRTPFFSLLPDHPWALEAQIEAGLEYDSSIATLLWQRAGTPISDQPFLFELAGGASIAELPIPACKWGPLTVRLIGGRCMRVLPRSVAAGHVRRCEEADLVGMMYLHSYEVPGLRLARHVPRGLGRKGAMLRASALPFEVGLGRMHRATADLLSAFRWAPACEVITRLREQGRLATVRWPDPSASQEPR